VYFFRLLAALSYSSSLCCTYIYTSYIRPNWPSSKLVSLCRSLQGNCYWRGFFTSVLCSHALVRFLRFWWSNLLSFQCEIVLDVFVLLNSIHYAWWSDIVYEFNKMEWTHPLQPHSGKRVNLTAKNRKNRIQYRSKEPAAVAVAYSAKPISEDDKLDRNMYCVHTCIIKRRRRRHLHVDGKSIPKARSYSNHWICISMSITTTIYSRRLTAMCTVINREFYHFEGLYIFIQRTCTVLWAVTM
jgi:hypothetical protein